MLSDPQYLAAADKGKAMKSTMWIGLAGAVGRYSVLLSEASPSRGRGFGGARLPEQLQAEWSATGPRQNPARFHRMTFMLKLGRRSRELKRKCIVALTRR